MIRILVDSSSDYLREEAVAKNIELIPISITIGEKTYIDGIDLDRNHFFQLLTSGCEFPKTSQPSPQAFIDVFKDAKAKGDELIYISLSSGLSGTYQSAVLAKDMAEYDHIYLIDSLSATFTIKVMADYACSLREEGLSAAEIVEKVEAIKAKVKCLAALDTLEYLAKGGRINKKIAAIGDMAQIKPIITLTEEGSIGILGKAIGRNKAINHILQHLQEWGVNTDFPIYPIYSYGTENCEKLEEKLLSEHLTPEERMQIGPTIGTHIGPEAFGVIFVRK